MDEQAKNELRVFKKFARVCPYPIDFGSIEKRRPTEPDIFCKFRDGRPIAFEISECIDEGIARSIYDPLPLKLRQVFYTELEKLSKEEKQKFKINFSNASINVAFCKGVSKNKKLYSIKTILKHLLTLKNGAEGNFDLTAQQNLKSIVGRIFIKQGPDEGPSFDIDPEAIWFSNPVVEQVKTKIDRNYKSKYKTELLCYYELQPELPQNHWLPSLTEFVKTNLKSSSFRRVWIYSVTKNKIVYVYPKYDKEEKLE